MRMFRFFVLFLLATSIGCNRPQREIPEIDHTKACQYSPSVDKDTLSPATEPTYRAVKGALLGTRFKSLEELKSVIKIEYFNDNASSDSMVRVSHYSNGLEVISVLETGVSQGDFSKARDGNLWDRLSLVIRSPFTVINRADLERAYILSRRIPIWFGEGDVAFFDLAETSVANINTEDLAFRHAKDSTEKGYLNSFNHITAQAFITSCFSEEMADFIADSHERFRHPELITGKFTEKQIKDLEEGPVDNYVDLINNEWGQEVGKALRKEHNISRETYWTPELLTNYLNDLQSYYSWAFQIGFKPFNPDDIVVLRFSNKINVLMKRAGGAVIGASGEPETQKSFFRF